MALEQGQCAVIRFECGVVLPGSLNAVRGSTFTFDNTRQDWGLLAWIALHLMCHRVRVRVYANIRVLFCTSLWVKATLATPSRRYCSRRMRWNTYLALVCDRVIGCRPVAPEGEMNKHKILQDGGYAWTLQGGCDSIWCHTSHADSAHGWLVAHGAVAPQQWHFGAFPDTRVPIQEFFFSRVAPQRRAPK